MSNDFDFATWEDSMLQAVNGLGRTEGPHANFRPAVYGGGATVFDNWMPSWMGGGGGYGQDAGPMGLNPVSGPVGTNFLPNWAYGMGGEMQNPMFRQQAPAPSYFTNQYNADQGNRRLRGLRDLFLGAGDIGDALSTPSQFVFPPAPYRGGPVNLQSNNAGLFNLIEMIQRGR